MRIVFWGTPELAVPCLRAICQAGHKILAVVTQPDRPQGRKRRLLPSPVKQFAQQNSLPVLQPETPNTGDFISHLQLLNPEVMVVVAYGKIFGKRILKIAEYGYLNVHFSLLPKYRGASPVTSAILAGDKQTGVTIMRIIPQMDAGPILATRPVNILVDDNTATLQQRLGECGASLLVETLPKLGHGQLAEIAQQESRASYCRTIKKTDGLINWNNSATYLERFIRAMQPWPTAYTFLQCSDKSTTPRIILRNAKVLNQKTTFACGTIIQVTNQGIDVATALQTLRILTLQKAGKAPLAAVEFLRGTTIHSGDVLTSNPIR